LLRLGSRSSKLATWQAKHIQSELALKNIEVEIVYISTEGDQSTQSLQDFGGQGAFTKRIQTALLDSEIDFAVHSLKDLPTESVQGLLLGAVPEREVTQDVLVSNKYGSIQDLPEGALIGTGSFRRQAQLLNHRPDLRVADIRGNVDTRLRKLDEEEYDALILAQAGLTRLGLTQRITEIISIDFMLPAIGQGALGLECRSEDALTIESLMSIDDAPSHIEVVAERALLRELRAGCLAPVGAHAKIKNHALNLEAVVLSQDGTERVHGERVAEGKIDLESGAALGVDLAQSLIANGAEKLLKK
jgi:hydroxymethylbilane synthase